MTSSAESVVKHVEDRTQNYKSRIEKALDGCLSSSNIPQDALSFSKKYPGKVRDVYVLDQKVLMVATDRQSGFDRALANVPFKGEVINRISAWWFARTSKIVPNHFIKTVGSRATLARKATVFPVEFVMRGFLTGSTNTSIWTHYEKGSREYCGHKLEDGMKKHQALPEPLLTPTTKDEHHDEPITAKDVVSSGRMTEDEWDFCAKAAAKLFAFGQEEASKRGLILVDTKYEFGKNEQGEIMLIDEIHTPDSSRFWIAETYEPRIKNGQDPETIDKEFLRRWFRERCDPYNDEVLPEVPADLIVELSRRYIQLYELITGEVFPFSEVDGGDSNAEEKLSNAVRSCQI